MRLGRPIPPSAALFVSAAALFVSIVAVSGADVGATIINRCTHGQSVSGFSEQDYRRALQELPTEVEEYSDCGRLIRAAQLAAAGGAGGGASTTAGGASAATPLTPAERSVLSRVPKLGAAPLVVGDATVNPGVVHADVASALSSLPTPLLATLGFLLACALVLAAGAVRNRVRARRSR
jgi:hypothetical protein